MRLMLATYNVILGTLGDESCVNDQIIKRIISLYVGNTCMYQKSVDSCVILENRILLQ